MNVIHTEAPPLRVITLSHPVTMPSHTHTETHKQYDEMEWYLRDGPTRMEDRMERQSEGGGNKV